MCSRASYVGATTKLTIEDKEWQWNEPMAIYIPGATRYVKDLFIAYQNRNQLLRMPKDFGWLKLVESNGGT